MAHRDDEDPVLAFRQRYKRIVPRPREWFRAKGGTRQHCVESLEPVGPRAIATVMICGRIVRRVESGKPTDKLCTECVRRYYEREEHHA